MLQTDDLHFSYPEELVALKAEPRGASRILHISRFGDKTSEINWKTLIDFFRKGDVLVLNDSKVLWARLIVEKPGGLPGEIFFLRKVGEDRWEVLARAMNLKLGKIFELPGGIKAEVVKVGRIAELKILQSVSLPDYFQRFGHVPLPPYITNLRARHPEFSKGESAEDKTRYQTVWATEWGSVAAPTAGLHFTDAHLSLLRERGVKITSVTLHVGAGTFLPLETGSVDHFQIHEESVEVSSRAVEIICQAKKNGNRVWACGTTVVRALETAAQKTQGVEPLAPLSGNTQIFIKPGFQFKIVDALLTNFHQPQSTLLALVASFGTLQPITNREEALQAVKKMTTAYAFAFENKFRLFSYGDLTVMV